jgi:hypothetical protein
MDNMENVRDNVDTKEKEEIRMVDQDTTTDIPAAPPTLSKKRAILEKIFLCVALFFPLFLATLDTSTVCYNSSNRSHCRNRRASHRVAIR